MNKFFKRLALLLAVLMIVSMMPVHLFADNSVTGEGQSNGTTQNKAVASYELNGKTISFEGETIREVNTKMRYYWEVDDANGCSYNADRLPADGTGALTWTIYGTVGQGEYLNSGALILPALSGGYIYKDGTYQWKNIIVVAGDENATIVSNDTFDVKHIYVSNGANATTTFTGITLDGSLYVVPNGTVTFDGCVFKGMLRVPSGNGFVKVANCQFVGDADEDSTKTKNEYPFFFQAGGTLEFIGNTIAANTYKRGLNVGGLTGLNATIENNTIGAVTAGYSAIQLSGKVTEAKIKGNKISLDGTNAFTLHESLISANKVTKVTVEGNTITGNGYLIYDDTDKAFTSENLKLTIGTNTVASTVDTTQGVKGSNKYGLSETVATVVDKALTPAYVATVNGVGYTSLAEAIAAAKDGDTIYVSAGEYTTYDNASPKKSLIFVGAGAGNTIWTIGDLSKNVDGEGNGDCSFDGCDTITFKDMTLKVDNANYRGFIRIYHTIVENCTLEGRTAYWGYETATFTGCTFNAPKGDYALWDYSTKTMTFDGCEFNISGKGVNVYVEAGNAGSEARKVEAKDCTINSTKANKAFLNIKNKTQAYEVTLSGDNKVNGLGANSTTGSNLYQVEATTITETSGKTVKVQEKASDGTLTTVYEVKAASTAVATVGGVEYTTLAEAIAALNSTNHTLTLIDESAWDEATPVYWQVGTQSGYAAKLTDALTAAYKANAGDITIVCRPGADVGAMTHGHVADNLTVYGNNAYISDGECDLEVDTYMYSRKTGKQVATGGVYLDKAITITAYELDNLGVWGHQRHTGYTINISLNDCDGKAIEGKANVQRVYISGTTGVNNITVVGCDFLTKATALYSNADGKITIDKCSFAGSQVPVNFNHKANGTQTVTVKNSTFTNCGDNGEWKQFAAPVRFVNSGSGTLTADVDNCTFTGTVGANGDILLGDGRNGEASFNVSVTVVDTAANVQIHQPGYYGADGSTTVANCEKTTVAKSNTPTTFFTVAVAEVTFTDGTTKKYSDIAEALEAANAGDTVTLLADINTPEKTYEITKSLTIDLNGKTVTGSGYDGVFEVTGKNINVVLNATNGGKVIAVENSGSAGKYAMAVWMCGADSTLTINGGEFTQNITSMNDKQMDMIYASAGTIIINSGSFTSGTPKWTLNIKDSAYKARTANIIVNGGTFTGYDPRNAENEGKGTSLVADGVGIDKNADGTFTAKSGMAAQIVDADGNSVAAYATLADAIAAADAGETLTLLTNIDVTNTLKITNNVIINLNGKTVTNVSGSNTFDVTGTLKIIGEGIVDLQANGIRVPGGNLEIAGGTFKYNNIGGAAVIMYGNANFKMTGGKLEIAAGAAVNAGYYGTQDIDISGGTIVCSHGSNPVFGVSFSPDVTLKVSGDANIKVGAPDKFVSGNFTKIAVSGGNFDAKIDDKYLAKGFELKDNADGTYGVKKAMNGSKKNPYTLKELGKMTRADYIEAQEALGGTMYVEIGNYRYDKNGVLGNGKRDDTTGQTEDRSVLNGYKSNGYLRENNDGANGKNIIFVGGSITSDVTGYASIDNIGTSLLLAVPAYTNVTFEGVTFNNVMSFDYQLYTSPWSQLGELKFSGCTFNGLIVGAIAAQTLTFNGCEFENYTNTTKENNSNPTWIRPAYGNWSKGDNEGQGSDFKSLTTINFTNNTVTSTRPVKFERIAQWEMETKVTVTGNKFDIKSDGSSKNVGLYFGANAKFDLVVDNNKKTDGTAALYTAVYKAPNGTDYAGLPAGSTVKDSNGADVEVAGVIWKTTDALTLKTTTEAVEVAGVKFATLEEAVAAVAKNGEEVTIKLLSNITAGGIDVAAGQNIVFDFDGHTYTLDGSMVGSTGTKTNGFRFLKGSTVVLKNGTLANGNGSPAKAMINSYATLKLVDFSVDARTTAVAETGSAYGYAALYISNGVTTVTGNGNYTTSDDNFVILIANVGDYTDGASLVFDENYTGTVSGRVSTGNKQNATVEIKNGKFELKSIDVENTNTTVTISGGKFKNIEIAGKYLDNKAFDTEADADGYYTVKDHPITNMGLSIGESLTLRITVDESYKNGKLKYTYIGAKDGKVHSGIVYRAEKDKKGNWVFRISDINAQRADVIYTVQYVDESEKEVGSAKEVSILKYCEGLVEQYKNADEAVKNSVNTLVCKLLNYSAAAMDYRQGTDKDDRYNNMTWGERATALRKRAVELCGTVTDYAFEVSHEIRDYGYDDNAVGANGEKKVGIEFSDKIRLFFNINYNENYTYTYNGLKCIPEEVSSASTTHRIYVTVAPFAYDSEHCIEISDADGFVYEIAYSLDNVLEIISEKNSGTAISNLAKATYEYCRALTDFAKYFK